MRFAAYAGTSTVLATAIVIRAFHQRANFYSACVYLSQSNACLMILTNLILLGVCLVMLSLQRLLYGPLRPIEIEQLYEKAWFAITETCLAMTIFREEVGAWFLVMFVGLLVGKVWGWIGEGRVEILEQQPPANPRLFHTRLSFSLLLSLVFDIAILQYSVQTVLQQARPNMMVMFAFEFAVLSITSSSTAARYSISLIEAYIIRRQTRAKIEERRTELRAARVGTQIQPASSDAGSSERQGPASESLPNEEEEIDEAEIDVPGWEDKGRWVFYLELVTDFMKLIVYLSFFFILLTFYGLPIHIMRDVFLTVRSFVKRINDFVRYRRATRDMNERYPDATAEEVAREEVCIICREQMQAPEPVTTELQNPQDEGARPAPTRPIPRHVEQRSKPKRLPCGHILHFGCLRSWLERQQICPTCRRPVMATNRVTVVPAPRGPALPIENRGPGRPAGRPHDPAIDQNNGRLGGQPQGHGRVFNLGPLRIGFGVAQAIGYPDFAAADQNQQAGGLPAAGADGQMNHLAQRRVTFGFGLGQDARAAVPTRGSQGHDVHGPTIQEQISQLEHRINREISHLRASAEQLRLIRGLQYELWRIRQMRTGLPETNAEARTDLQELQHTPSPLQIHIVDPQASTVEGGQAQLPADMVLPPGWTLMPLRRLHPNNNQQTAAFVSAADPMNHRPAGGSVPQAAPSTSQAAAADVDESTVEVPGALPDFSGTLQDQGDHHGASSANGTVSGEQSSESPLSGQTKPTPDTPGTNHAAIESSASGLTAQEDGNSLPVPAWGSETTDTDSQTPPWGLPDATRATAAGEGPSADGGSSIASPVPSSTKGKGKAVTIEDEVDDENRGG